MHNNFPKELILFLLGCILYSLIVSHNRISERLDRIETLILQTGIADNERPTPTE